MALLDWLGLGAGDSAAPDDPQKKKAAQTDMGTDVINAFGLTNDAAKGKGAFGPGGTFMDASEFAKKNATMGFWASLLGGK